MVKHKKTFEELEILPVNKWQDGSAKLTRLRLQFENVLNKFDKDDRQTDSYKKLFESVELMFKHFNEEYNPDYAEQQKKISRWAWIRATIIAVGGILATVIAENTSTIGSLLSKLFGGN